MRNIPEIPAPRGPLAGLLCRADRRRRARIVFAAIARALWPGLVAAIVFAGAWRVAGGPALGVAAAACVLLPAAIGLARGLRRRDLLAAASELDRRSDLEAALSTGVEVAEGRIAGPLSAAALAEAEFAAARVGHDVVPVSPPRARYLALPGAVLAGVLLVPGGAARRPGGYTLVPADGAAGAETGDAGESPHDDAARARIRPPDKPAPTRDGPRDDLQRAGRDEENLLPPRPTRSRGRKAQKGRSRTSGALAPESHGGSGAGAPDPDAGAPPPGRGAGGALDLGESGLILERFPEYEDIVRRYFAGPRSTDR